MRSGYRCIAITIAITVPITVPIAIVIAIAVAVAIAIAIAIAIARPCNPKQARAPKVTCMPERAVLVV